MPYLGTMQYRLAGNLFDNKYYLPDVTPESAIASLVAIQTAAAQFQTPDVEYVSGTITDIESPYATQSVPFEILNGQADGEPTMPSITFLEFVFYPTNERGKTTHRIRGCAANDITDLGVFNAQSVGDGDIDGSGAGGVVANSAYLGYLAAVVEFSVDRNQRPLTFSTRVSVGAKRATRRL